ncbi:MAG: hypothetical protein PVI23_05850 [Maricaulaceae bacterium]|jgi:hypothetical protein
MTKPPPPPPDDLRVVPADTLELLDAVQALRYRVFVGELGLQPEGADHSRRVLIEIADATGRNFIGLRGDEAVGSVRINVVADGGVDDYVATYGIAALGAGFEEQTAIVTRLIRRGEKGAGPLIYMLVTEILRVVAERKLRYIVIGASAELEGFYLAMGFTLFRDPVISPSGAERMVFLIDVKDQRHMNGKTLVGWLYPDLFRSTG